MKKICTKMLALLLILLTLFAITGCQPTPDEPPVVGKNNTNALVEGTEAPYEAPEHWKEDKPIILKDLTVTIDADILTPNVAKYPVVSVRDKVFTQEEADKIISVLSQGKQLYSNKETRSELEQYLITLKAEVERLKKEDSSSELILIYEQYQIPNIEKRIQKLPEQDTEEPPVTDFAMSEYGWEQISVRADAGQNVKAAITIINGSDTMLQYGYAIASSSVFFIKGPNYNAYNQEKNEVLAEDTAPVGIQTTREEAIALTQQMIRALGISDLQLAQVRPAYRVKQYVTGVLESQQSWQIVYTPQVDGIPVTFYKDNAATIVNGAMSSEGYNADYSNPIVAFYVDDSGIAVMRWMGPMEIGETLNENVKLLDFSEIQERIREQLPISYAYPKGNAKTTQVHVTSIQLGYMRARVKDTQDEYMLMPIWDVFGYNDQTNSITGKAKTNPQNFIETMMTVNAMDGSVIDRRLGY
ncbi:MAG: DUF6034 family protein [Christensenellales bacterium]